MAAPGFQYFTSSDAGAPVLSATAGRMIAVLDWALVGKGGWQKAFSGTNTAAYRSLSGNRFYLRVDDTQTTFARIRGYRNMTAVSTGSNQFPPTSVAAASSWGAPKSDGSPNTARRYWGIRTNRYIMMFVESEEFGASPILTRPFFAFGDVPTLCEVDTFNTVIVGSDSPLSNIMPALLLNSPSPTSLYTLSAGPHMAATPNGDVSSVGAVMFGGFAPYTGAYTSPSLGSQDAGRLQYSPIQIYSGRAIAGGTTGGIVRAVMPNLLHAFGPTQKTAYPDSVPFTHAGRSFIPLSHQVYDPALDGNNDYADGFVMIQLNDTGEIL